jgi:hypothetical protein
MRADPVIRPGFHPLSIGLMVLGFVVAWPLGLAMLAYMIWGDRLQAFFEGVRDGYRRSRFAAEMRRGFGPAGFTASGFGTTGNAAFDAYRAAELERLEAERRRLDEERREFEAYMAHLRRARDQEEFDRFKAERAASRMRGGDPTRS